MVDTGATVDIIDSTTYAKFKRKSSLRKSSTKIFAYGFHTPLPQNGQFQATLESKKRYTVSQIYVIDGAGGNLLSAKTAQDLALVQLINTISGFLNKINKQRQIKTIHTALHARSIHKSTQVFINQKTQKYKKS